MSVMEMSNDLHDDLIQRRILYPDPDEFALSAGTHRDWPGARGLYCSSWTDDPAITVWVNFEDHVSVGTCAVVTGFCLSLCEDVTNHFSPTTKIFEKSRRAKEATYSTFFGNFLALCGPWKHHSIYEDKSLSKIRGWAFSMPHRSILARPYVRVSLSNSSYSDNDRVSRTSSDGYDCFRVPSIHRMIVGIRASLILPMPKLWERQRLR